MKLKELHLRNIAAIEKADIDFQNDLIDTVTGLPAPIFLISGDTGTGKSVILDGIALALYKNTPRLEGVSNRKNNEFTSVDGFTLNVFSIEQYTRMGISEKDDCYSEVVFEDNRGTEYRAKLTLGMTKTREVDEATGRRLLKHSTPAWTVKVSDEDWKKVEANTGEPIQSAIQLTFEQFTRMAMLAQGQFAAFLTGGKEEREKILEQLTNTEKFTKYGKAIDSIYKGAKNDKAQAEKVRDTESEHVLPEEVVRETEARLKEVKDSYNNKDKELQATAAQLRHIETIEAESVKRKKADEEIAAAQAEQAGEAYQSAQRLIADWQKTAQVRQQLTVKDEALRKKREAENAIGDAHKTFRLLMADLAARQANADALGVQIAALDEWLQQREDRKALYAEASAVGVKLDNYKEQEEKLAKDKAALLDEQAKTAHLKAAEEEAKVQHEQAQNAVDGQQKLIDQKTTERKALRPEELNQQQANITSRIHELQQLGKDYAQLQDDTRHAEEQLRIIADERRKLDEEQANANDKAAAYTAANAKAEECTNRYFTMSASVDEQLSRLRHQLSQGHSEVCPLCGQHLDTILRDDEFRSIITPLEAEKRSAEVARAEAEKAWNEAKTIFDRHQGVINGLVDQSRKDATALAKLQRQVDQLAEKVGIVIDAQFDSVLKGAVEEAQSRQQEIATQQQKVQQLQNEIDSLLKDKQQLDKAAQTAYRRYTNAQNAVKNNADQLKRIEALIMGDETQLKSTGEALDTLLAGFRPQWHTNIEETQTLLKEQARVYAEKRQERDDKASKQNAARQELDNISSNRDAIFGAHADWEETVEALPFRCSNINTEWAQLTRTLSAAENQLAQSTANLDSSQKAIDEYCQASGHDEAYLRGLALSEARHDEASKLVDGVKNRLTAATALRESAAKTIEDTLAKMGVTTIADIPEKAGLTVAKERLTQETSLLQQEHGNLQRQLDDNAQNSLRLCKAEEALAAASARYDKWDKINRHFGGTRFRTLVQTHVLRPLLNNANIYLTMITDRYHLTCSAENEQLSILVHDHYNKDQVRSVTILSGGERFMISLALSLALSSLNRPDLNVDILFIDEGFGTLDEKNLNSVMATLEKLQEIAGQTQRRVGIISHRTELEDRIPVQIKVVKRGEGRSHIEFQNEIDSISLY